MALCYYGGHDLCNDVHKVVSQFVLLHHIVAVATILVLYCTHGIATYPQTASSETSNLCNTVPYYSEVGYSPSLLPYYILLPLCMLELNIGKGH